jgi:hypothetical protein
MDSNVLALMRIIPPPAIPVAAKGNWQRIEQDLGLQLPEDYKAIVETYGSGEFFDFVWVASPFVSNTVWSLAYQARIQGDNFRNYADEGFDVPYSAYPDEGGLICFGSTTNCNCLSWLPVGPPEKWSLVLWDPDFLKMRQFPSLSLGGLLLQLANKVNLETADGAMFPDDLLDRLHFVSKNYDSYE